MSNKKPPKKRTHAGVCLTLLDDKHKLLMREMAFLLQRVARLSVEGEVEYLETRGLLKRCPVCSARSEQILDTYEDATFEALPLVHDTTCSGQHAARLLENDRALRVLADLEWVHPLTTSGKSVQQSLDVQLDTINAEVAP